MVTETDCAWTAEIVDGEGCLGIYKNGRGTFRMRPILQVGNTDMRMIERLHDLWGGVFFESTRRDRPRSKRIWSWHLYGMGLLRALEMIRPYLVCKAEKAETILTWANR